jgi:hypothetical protein
MAITVYLGFKSDLIAVSFYLFIAAQLHVLLSFWDENTRYVQTQIKVY